MSLKISRRAFAASAAVIPIAMQSKSMLAQTPVAFSSEDLFAGLELTPGSLDTSFGPIDLPVNPQRIVTLNDGALDAMLALGMPVVGYTASSNGDSAAEYLLEKVPADAQIIGGWGELQLEEIILLEPDLIISDPWLDEGVYATLSQLAPIVSIETEYESDPLLLQPWEVEQLTFGFTVGKLDEAKDVILELRNRGADVAKRLADHAGASVVVFRPQPEFPVVMSHEWITGTVFSWCGFVGNEYTIALEPPHSRDSLSMEQLNQLEADWLFAAARTDDMAEALQGYLDNPGFQMITAVKIDQVKLVAGDLWSGSIGVLAGHAMMDDIERIIVDGQ